MQTEEMYFTIRGMKPDSWATLFIGKTKIIS